MTQPDLGTGLVYLVIGAVALIMGGARWKYLIVLLGVFVGLIVAVFAIDEVLKNATGDYVLLAVPAQPLARVLTQRRRDGHGF